jgi:hypothetical protein
VKAILAWIKRRRMELELDRIRDFEAQLHDQIDSGRAALRKWQARGDKIERALMAHLTPDEIVGA